MQDQRQEIAQKIANILIRSELITAEGLQDALHVAEKMNLPLGRVFEMNGQMSERSVSAAAALQDQLDKGQIKLDQAIKVMDAVGRRGIDLETALRQIRHGRGGRGPVDVGNVRNKVGDLMSLAGVVSPQQMKQGLYDSINTGLPLGMTLVQKNMILSTVLEWCLKAAQLVKDKTLTEEQAAHAIRLARLNRQDFDKVLRSQGVPAAKLAHEFGLGDLLVFATSITETQLLAAREIALEEDKELEQVFIECGMVPAAIVGASKQLLGLINNGSIFEDHAATVIKKLMRCSSMEKMQAIFTNLYNEVESKVESKPVMELIAMCRIMSPEQLAEGIKLSRTSKAPLIQSLVQEGILAVTTVEAAEECKRFIEMATLDVEQATIALSYAAENETTFEGALNHFGWNRQLSHA